MADDKKTEGYSDDSVDVTQRFRSPVEDSFYESFVIRSRSNVGSLYAANLSSSQRHVQQVKYIEREKYVQLASMEKGQRQMLKKMEQLKQAQELTRRKSLGANLGVDDKNRSDVRKINGFVNSFPAATMDPENSSMIRRTDMYNTSKDRSVLRTKSLSPLDTTTKFVFPFETTGKKGKEPFRSNDFVMTRKAINFDDKQSMRHKIKKPWEEISGEDLNENVVYPPDTKTPRNQTPPIGTSAGFSDSKGSSHVRFLPKLPVRGKEPEGDKRDNSTDETNGKLVRRTRSSMSIVRTPSAATSSDQRGRSMSLGSSRDWEQVVQKTTQLKSDTRHSMTRKDVQLSTKTKWIPQVYRTGSVNEGSLL